MGCKSSKQIETREKIDEVPKKRDFEIAFDVVDKYIKKKIEENHMTLEKNRTEVQERSSSPPSNDLEITKQDKEMIPIYKKIQFLESELLKKVDKI
jgi:hypothetical protein